MKAAALPEARSKGFAPIRSYPGKLLLQDMGVAAVGE